MGVSSISPPESNILKIQLSTTKMSKTQLFRFSAAAARAHPSIKQAEHLKINPVPGVRSWYEVSNSDNRMFASKVNLLDVNSGKSIQLNLDANFPETKPVVEGMEVNLDNARNLKAVVQNILKQMQ